MQWPAEQHRFVLVLDSIGTVCRVSPGAAELLGYPAERLLGLRLGTPFVGDSNETWRINRALKALSKCNAALLRAREESELLSEICRLIVEVGGYRMVWVGGVEEDEAKTVRPVAAAGFVDGYLDLVNVTWADSPRGRGPAGQAIRTGRSSVFQDIRLNPDFLPWREEAASRGYAAVAALPLAAEGRVFGALCIYAGEAYAFDGEEVRLLSDLSANLAYGITALRLRRQQEQSQAEIRRAQELLDSIVENIPDVIMLKDARELRCLRVNRAGEELFGCAREQLIGHDECDFLPLAEAEQCRARDREAIRGERLVDVAEQWVHTHQGLRVLHTKRIPLKDEAGEVQYLLTIAADATEQMKSEVRLFYMANYDALTGLPNRTLLRDRLQHALAKARHQGERVAVLFLDLDQFKTINDTLGHSVGDQLLKMVAERLRNFVREGDTLARLGGDEFAIVLEPVSHEEDAALVANKVLDAIAHPLTVDGHEVFTTISIGITTYPSDGDDADTLLKNADTAMYRAKESGRSNYQFYTADMNVRALERLFLDNSLRRAEERGELRLYYQPQVSLRTGRIVGVEALIRWEHPELGLLTPDKFIPLAEETRLIVPLGAWVLRTACRERKLWASLGLPPIRVAVNISPRQFRHGDLAQLIAEVLAESGMDADGLELELTESALLENTESSASMLRKLRDMGLGIAIDDFGTGYSSLSYLKRFPIDVVKIDRAFVRDISTDPDDAAIVEAIIAMAHSLRLRVTAEGVETEEQLSFLHAHGCDEIQGYLLARPMPRDEFRAWLRRQTSP